MNDTSELLMNKFKTRLKIRLKAYFRRIVRLFDWEPARDRENNFALRQIVGKGSTVVDVGGCDSLVPLTLAKKGFKVTVFDFRKYPENHRNLISIEGDFLNNTLDNESYDYVLMISAIDHFGLGAYGDPIYEDADFATMAEVKRILKQNGKAIITVPFTRKHKIIPGLERHYDIERIHNIFKGFKILAEEYYTPDFSVFGKTLNFTPASLSEIQQLEDITGKIGCACYALAKIS